MTTDVLVSNLRVLREIRDITGAGSQKMKADLLRKYDSINMRYILRVAFDPFLRTNIKKIGTSDTSSTVESVYDFESLITLISRKKALTASDRMEVALFVSSFTEYEDSEELKEILSKVLTKQLNIGIATKSINKALGEQFLPAAELMKAEDDIAIVEKWLQQRIPVYAEFKYDGIRGFARINPYGVQSIKTYNMRDFDLSVLTHVVPQLKALYDVFRKYYANEDIFFDFEVTDGMRQSVGGQVNRVLQGTAPEGIDKNWVLSIFDVGDIRIVTEDMQSPIHYETRRNVLERLFQTVQDAGISMPNIQIASNWTVTSMDWIQNMLEKIWTQGDEGLVIKRGDGVYECKRSKNWIKLKAVNDCDLVVTGWYKGREGTKRERFGGFSCESSCGQLKVDIGGGYSDTDIDDFFANGIDTYVGQIMTVLYNTIISKDGTDVKSLFLPRFKMFRDDKTEADALKNIKK